MKIVYFRAKHRDLGFVNKPHAVNRNVSCATRQTCTKFLFTHFSLQEISFHAHMCDPVHLLSMELVPCKLFNMLTIFKNLYGMFETARECTHKKGFGL